VTSALSGDIAVRPSRSTTARSAARGGSHRNRAGVYRGAWLSFALGVVLTACGAEPEQADARDAADEGQQAPQSVPAGTGPLDAPEPPATGAVDDSKSGPLGTPATSSDSVVPNTDGMDALPAGTGVDGSTPTPGDGPTSPLIIPPGSDFGTPGASDILPGTGPLGVETTCDGVDDDGNGVVDDVDAAGDGVCDCLSIATLGLHGEWGAGDVVSGWLRDRITSSVTDLDDETLTLDLLRPFQVLLVRDISSNHNPGLSFSAEEAQALWQWVREGGGLMTLIGYSDAGEINNVNTLLSPFSLRYGADQIIPGQGAAAAITEWFEHPVTAGVKSVGADNGYPALGQGTVIAADDGYDVGIAVTIGDGHVLVWGDEWVTYEDEWIGDSSFQVDVFWQNSLRWLTRANECQVPAP